MKLMKEGAYIDIRICRKSCLFKQIGLHDKSYR